MSQFSALRKLGYQRLVPIIPPGAPLSENSALYKNLSKGRDPRGKAVGVKNQDGLWHGIDWLNMPDPTDDRLAAWHSMGAGVGIRTGGGVIAIDIDAKDPEYAEKANELAKQILGPAPIRQGQPPKLLRVYATTPSQAPFPYQRVDFVTPHSTPHKPERVELLSEGRQFVAYGTHPATRKPFQWLKGPAPYDKLTIITQEQVTRYFKELEAIFPQAAHAEYTTPTDRKTVDQQALCGDPDLVRKAVAALPNTTELFPTYDDYIRVGAAIKGATQHDPELGKELFLQWTSRWEGGNDAEQSLSDYHRIKPPFELGCRYLYDMAARLNGSEFSLADVWFHALEDEQPTLLEQVAETEAQADKADREAKAKRQLPITKAADLAIYDPNNAPEPLVKGLLDKGAFSVIYGRSNSGKTFVAMDLAFHIAAGMEWAKMPSPHGGVPVVYIAAEGGQGVKKRVAALMQTYPDSAAATQMALVLSNLDLFSPEGDTAAVVNACSQVAAECGGQKVGLIVIDTLARAMAGGDENSAKDMGVLIANVDKVRAATGAHVMVIHHSGKDATKGARGSNALLGAVDTEIEIADNQIVVTKQRDLDKSFSSGFELKTVQLGVDGDGAPVTSCVIGLVDRRDVIVGNLTPNEYDVLKALDTLGATSPAEENPGKEGVRLDQLLIFFGGKLPQNAVRQAVHTLMDKGQIRKVGRGRFIRTPLD